MELALEVSEGESLTDREPPRRSLLIVVLPTERGGGDPRSDRQGAGWVCRFGWSWRGPGCVDFRRADLQGSFHPPPHRTPLGAPERVQSA